MLAETILSLMLAVGPKPGVSPYSVVPTTETAKPCSSHKPACRKPWFSAYHKGLVRQETRSEALSRYWVIAQAIAGETKKDRHLCKLLLSVTLHESGWRRDIHSGKGKFALGDDGRSFSLVQANLGRGAREGFRLIGVGPKATGRAIAWGAKHLRRCSRRGTPIQAFSCYGGVANGSKHPGIKARAASYRRFSAKPTPLSKQVRELLGLPERKDKS